MAKIDLAVKDYIYLATLLVGGSTGGLFMSNQRAVVVETKEAKAEVVSEYAQQRSIIDELNRTQMCFPRQEGVVCEISCFSSTSGIDTSSGTLGSARGTVR